MFDISSSFNSSLFSSYITSAFVPFGRTERRSVKKESKSTFPEVF